MKLAKGATRESATGAAAEASSVAAVTATIMETAQSFVHGVVQGVSSWGSHTSIEPSSSAEGSESGVLVHENLQPFEPPLPNNDGDEFDDSDL
jgi:hypothetical protein